MLSVKVLQKRIEMITKLDHTQIAQAKGIHTVFQKSYKIEAQLIGVENFPPLSRSIEDIASSKSEFYGFIDQQTLAAVIEIQISEQHLDIHSLTVDPQFFRKGIAGKLINYVLNECDIKQATVETALVNAPAIKLYNKYGFAVFKQWTPSHGIEKVALRVDCT